MNPQSRDVTWRRTERRLGPRRAAWVMGVQCGCVGALVISVLGCAGSPPRAAPERSSAAAREVPVAQAREHDASTRGDDSSVDAGPPVRAVDSETAPGSKRTGLCRGDVINLDEVAGFCVTRLPEGKVPTGSNKALAISVRAVEPTVETGERLKLHAELENQSDETQTVYFHVPRLDPDSHGTDGFDIAAYDAKGRTVDVPSDIGLLGLLRGRGGKVFVRLVVAPRGKIVATTEWKARGFWPDRKYATRGSSIMEPELLQPGKYTLKVRTPLRGRGAVPLSVVTVRVTP